MSTPGQQIVAIGNGKVEVRETEIPAPDDWHILVKLERSAISSGTESHVVRNLAREGHACGLGYAPVARIEAVGGSAAPYFNEGDRVIYFAPDQPPEGPRHCGGGHQSPALLNVSPETRDLLGPDQFCVKIPEGVPSEQAAFAGIAAVSSMGASMPGTKPGDKVLVLGQGLIGQFAAQHFRLRGAEVAVSDLDARRLELATTCGADHVINAAEQDTVEALRTIWPKGADIVADTTGSHRVIEATLGAIRTRGKYVFLGWCKGSDFAIERLQGQKIFEAYFPWTLEGPHVLHSLRMMQLGALLTEPMVTHRVAVSEAPAIYEMVLHAPDKYLGIVFNWDEASTETSATK